uniref:Reverse transcriptase zinc-binding domain-containing protein n=1 Tax=Setaria viridis TaxID=4556 RepID=A0A4V6DBG3_SETVI|nr:hypothetical protein SEVIR_2G258200v2 [Setaria viridis]
MEPTLLLHCKFVRHLWRALWLEEQRRILAGKQSAQEVIKQILSVEEGLQMKVITLLWLWWLVRSLLNENCTRNRSDIGKRRITPWPYMVLNTFLYLKNPNHHHQRSHTPTALPRATSASRG